MTKNNKQISKLLKVYHEIFDCFGNRKKSEVIDNRKKIKEDSFEWYVTTIFNNDIQYIISKKNNIFYINKEIPNKSCYPKYYNQNYAGHSIRVLLDAAKSLKKAKQIITNDKENVINEA